jgi:hypothetical protein
MTPSICHLPRCPGPPAGGDQPGIMACPVPREDLGRGRPATDSATRHPDPMLRYGSVLAAVQRRSFHQSAKPRGEVATIPASVSPRRR